MGWNKGEDRHDSRWLSEQQVNSILDSQSACKNGRPSISVCFEFHLRATPFVNESDSNPGGNSLTKSYEKNK